MTFHTYVLATSRFAPAAWAIAISAFLGQAQAAAPLANAQAPGFARMMIGGVEVTALSDGDWELPVNQLLLNTTSDEVDALLAKSFLKSPLKISTNAYVINTGTKLVLVDTGAGETGGPTAGHVLANLRAAGYQPEQVDDVFITHMHNDHIGGLMASSALVFPNATIHADKHDADYWLGQSNLDHASPQMKPWFQLVNDMLQPYVKAGHFSTFDGQTELMPGFKALPSYGHTLGHTIYALESHGQSLVLWGDIVHIAEVQFDRPNATISFDTDPQAAIASRKRAFASAAADGSYVAVAHFPFPGIGHLKATGKAYAWVPVSSAALPKE